MDLNITDNIIDSPSEVSPLTSKKNEKVEQKSLVRPVNFYWKTSTVVCRRESTDLPNKY